jgi:hypothetical protein
MVEVHLYGKLRRYAEEYRPMQDTVILLESDDADTLGLVLERTGIPINEVNHVFFNAKLLATRNRMGSFYGYPQVGADLSGWDLDVAVGDGDRIGLFGKDMAILGM